MRQADDTYARALAQAAEKVGGIEALAAKLDVSRILLRAFINGTHEVPVAVFLKTVDLLMDERLAQSRSPDQAHVPPRRPGDDVISSKG